MLCRSKISLPLSRVWVCAAFVSCHKESCGAKVGKRNVFRSRITHSKNWANSDEVPAHVEESLELFFFLLHCRRRRSLPSQMISHFELYIFIFSKCLTCGKGSSLSSLSWMSLSLPPVTSKGAFTFRALSTHDQFTLSCRWWNIVVRLHDGNWNIQWISAELFNHHRSSSASRKRVHGELIQLSVSQRDQLRLLVEQSTTAGSVREPKWFIDLNNIVFILLSELTFELDHQFRWE